MSRPQTLTHPSTSEHLAALFGDTDTDILNAVRSPPGYSIEQRVKESAPLYLRTPLFRTKQIWQELPYPKALNTLYLQIGTNVPLVKGTQLNIKGFTSKSPDIVLRGTSVGTAEIFPLMCGAGEECTGSKYSSPMDHPLMAANGSYLG